MKSAIEKLYYGETNSEIFETSAEWKRLKDKSFELYEKLIKSLNEEQINQIEEILLFESGELEEELLQCYKEGFKLGLKLATEALI